MKKQHKIRYAVVGLGHLAQIAILPAFRNAKNSELAALVSGDREKQRKLSAKYGVDSVYSYDQYEECLSHGIDAVYIVLPNHLHREYTVRAAHAGVHVLCEKPLAVTEEDCEAMIHAADKNGVKLMTAYRLYLEEGYLEAMRLADRGVLGDLRMFSSEFSLQVAEDNVRTLEIGLGGGPVYDIGVYCINAVRNLFHDEPMEVFATTANNGEARFKKVEEMTSVIMRFRGERLATLTCSFGAAPATRYTLIGTKGTLTLDPAYEFSMGIKHQLTVGERTSVRTFPKRDQFAAELVYFSNCILNDEEPRPSGAEGLADVRVIRTIYESAQAGKTIQLPPMPAKHTPGLRQQIYKPTHGQPKSSKATSQSGEGV